MTQSRKLRVGVIFGGRSSEHEVSIASARSVIGALDRDKYEVVEIGITRTGRWLTSGEPMKELVQGTTDADPAVGALLAMTRTGKPDVRGDARIRGYNPLGRLDVVIPVLHGPNGEDGTVQGLLELANVPYVGAGVLGSALGMDKAMMKDVLRHHRIPIAEYIVIRSNSLGEKPGLEKQVGNSVGYPCFVKPANMGSSIGISKVHGEAELRPALEEAAKYDRKIVVEEFINGRELECSVLGNEHPQASVVGEILPCNEFYDYKAKYIDQRSRLIIPADIPEEASDAIRHLAVRAFLALDCWGMARCDFFMERSTGKLIVNELNTIPGFTKISMYPKLWEASGLPYHCLIEKLIDLAFEKHAERQRIQDNLQAISPDRGGGVL